MKLRVLFLALALPAALNAQTSATAQSAAQASTPQTRIDAAMQAAARADIPAALLRSKVEEGQAKHVPPQRIAAAVEARLDALVKASKAMKQAQIESTTEGELAVAADAMQAGVSQNALVKVYRDAPDERRAVAVAVLTDLVRLGKANEHALARVSAAVRSNAALANLQAEVASQLQSRGLGATVTGTLGVGLGRKQ